MMNKNEALDRMYRAVYWIVSELTIRGGLTTFEIPSLVRIMRLRYDIDVMRLVNAELLVTDSNIGSLIDDVVINTRNGNEIDQKFATAVLKRYLEKYIEVLNEFNMIKSGNCLISPAVRESRKLLVMEGINDVENPDYKVFLDFIYGSYEDPDHSKEELVEKITENAVKEVSNGVIMDMIFSEYEKNVYGYSVNPYVTVEETSRAIEKAIENNKTVIAITDIMYNSIIEMIDYEILDRVIRTFILTIDNEHEQIYKIGNKWFIQTNRYFSLSPEDRHERIRYILGKIFIEYRNAMKIKNRKRKKDEILAGLIVSELAKDSKYIELSRLIEKALGISITEDIRELFKDIPEVKIKESNGDLIYKKSGNIELDTYAMSIMIRMLKNYLENEEN